MATNEIEELRKQLESLQRALRNGSFRPAEEPNVPDENDSVNAVLSRDSNEEDELCTVQDQLPSLSFDHEHLREHLKNYNFDEHGRKILASILQDPMRLARMPCLFPLGPGPADDRSHYSHFQVYDVGPDGLAQLLEPSGDRENMSKAVEIWHSIRDIGKSTSEKVVGHITVAREPSPILFGALHLTMHKIFDMDEVFGCLVQSELSSSHMHRTFHEDPTHHNTFLFNFAYYTVIGEDCKPMEWQLADKDNRSDGTHIQLSRCSVVVALALCDDKPRRILNKERRARTKYGWMSDIWSPWHVLQIECFPDWKATPDTFESGHQYLNGPEAFLHALLSEYVDAKKRYDSIYRGMAQLVQPPPDFVFDKKLRDQRLFDDEDYTWTRRYFYVHRTLNTINGSISSMIDAFEETFSNDFWEGKSATIWPLFEDSPRNNCWKTRLQRLKAEFDQVTAELRVLQRKNDERRHEIEYLQEHLFSGTSIRESRTSLQQGRNIKLLTIVNLFFMPLTFVTSIFGMTNMPPYPASFSPFGITLAAICVPLFSLIGFLSTNFGYRIWERKTKALYHWILRIRAYWKSQPKNTNDALFNPRQKHWSLSNKKGAQSNLGEQENSDTEQNDKGEESHPNIKKMVKAIGEGRQSGPVWNEKAVEEDKSASKDAVIDIENLVEATGEGE